MLIDFSVPVFQEEYWEDRCGSGKQRKVQLVIWPDYKRPWSHCVLVLMVLIKVSNYRSVQTYLRTAIKKYSSSQRMSVFVKKFMLTLFKKKTICLNCNLCEINSFNNFYLLEKLHFYGFLQIQKYAMTKVLKLYAYKCLLIFDEINQNCF